MDGTLVETIHHKCEFRNGHEKGLFYVGDDRYGTFVQDLPSTPKSFDMQLGNAIGPLECIENPSEEQIHQWLRRNSFGTKSSGEPGVATTDAAGNGIFISSFNGDRMEVRGSTMTIFEKGSNKVKAEVNNVNVPRFEGEFPWGALSMVWDGDSWQESGSSNVFGFLANARWEAAGP